MEPTQRIAVYAAQNKPGHAEEAEMVHLTPRQLRRAKKKFHHFYKHGWDKR